MALSKSDKSGSNVTNLDDARKSRAKSPSELNRKDSNSDELGHEPRSTQSDEKNDAKPAKAKKKVGNRRFDKVKVERIKGEIARGEYEIDFLHVADKFIEHERYS